MIEPVDSKSALPIYVQIVQQIRRAIAAGRLAPGDQMPSVRELASRLLVNPNTAARVYRDLEREGLLETRRGQGTYVSGTVAALVESERRRLIADRMRLVAGDVREFGMDPQEALRLFSQVLDDTQRDKGVADGSE